MGWGTRTSLSSLCLFAVLTMVACAGPGSGSPGAGEESVIPDTTIVAAQEELTPTVMALSGVVGTAVGLCNDVPCIKVYLARRDEELMSRIPDMYRGFKVDIEVSGEFQAQDESP